MTEVVREWLAKAANDLKSARLEIERGETANWDLMCFLSQQSVEKLIKGALIDRETLPQKSHDLVQLSRMFGTVMPVWNWDEAELQFLTMASVIYGYPGQWADREVASRAMAIANRLHDALLPLVQNSR